MAAWRDDPEHGPPNQCQSVDELRHCQTQIHTISNYNRYYAGFHSWSTAAVVNATFPRCSISGRVTPP